MIIRKEIMAFAQAMEKVMQKHDLIKGDSWKEMSHQALQTLLRQEMVESECDNAKIGEWIDIANICMMIYNNTLN